MKDELKKEFDNLITSIAGRGIKTDEEIDAAMRAEATDARRRHLHEQNKILNAPMWWTFENLRAEPWPELWNEVKAKQNGDQRSILITAPTNSGKSHAAVAMARILAEQLAEAYSHLCKWRYMTVYRIKEHELCPLWEVSRYRRSADIEERIEKAMRADVLVYDDLGKVELVRGDGFALSPFGCVIFSIFDERAEKRKINIVTSRYDDLTHLQRAVGVDLIRRIVQLEGNDFHGRVLQKKENAHVQP